MMNVQESIDSRLSQAAEQVARLLSEMDRLVPIEKLMVDTTAGLTVSNESLVQAAAALRTTATALGDSIRTLREVSEILRKSDPAKISENLTELDKRISGVDSRIALTRESFGSLEMAIERSATASLASVINVVDGVSKQADASIRATGDHLEQIVESSNEAIAQVAMEMSEFSAQVKVQLEQLSSERRVDDRGTKWWLVIVTLLTLAVLAINVLNSLGIRWHP